MHLQYEHEFDEAILEDLKNCGHILEEVAPGSGFAALTAVSRYHGKIAATFDPRRPGSYEL